MKNIVVFLDLCTPQRESKLIFIPVHDVGQQVTQPVCEELLTSTDDPKISGSWGKCLLLFTDSDKSIVSGIIK